MRYRLEGLDANTLEIVQGLRTEIRKLAEKKSRVGKGEVGRQRAKAIDSKIATNRKRLGELTGQPYQAQPFVNTPDTAIPTTPKKSKKLPKKSNQWVQILPGGAPGLGKRS